MSQNLYLREIQPGDLVAKLSLGNAQFTPLKMFLKKSALDFHQLNIAKTMVLVEKQAVSARVWGYLTLMTSEVTLDIKQRPGEGTNAQNYEVFPAVKIARLAVDKELQGCGYGSALLDYCVTTVRQYVMQHVGCRFLVVDAKPDAILFYQRAGFIMVDNNSNKNSVNPAMFFDLHKLQNHL